MKYKVCYILIIINLIFFGLCTYAYYRENVNVKELTTNISTDKNLVIKFATTTNIALVSSNIGDEINKAFSVTNTTNEIVHYHILFKDVKNNFNNLNNLKYNLISNDGGANINNVNAPVKESYLAGDIIILPKETHNYVLNIKFIENDYDQSEDINKMFSSKILVESINQNKHTNISIKNTIIKNLNSNEDNTDNGVFYTNNSIDGKTVYYYKGNIANNNLVIDNICFKIVRTTEDNGVRLIYNGDYIDNKCNTDSIYKNTSSFNLKTNSNAYVGYMYGKINSDNYNNEHENINSSSIKIYLDSWYNKHRDILDKYIKLDSVYCNNRKPVKLVKKGISYNNLGYGNLNSAYQLKKEYYNGEVSYNCELNDRFSNSNTNGNGNLNDPVGLITVEELYYAGFIDGKDNKTNFLSLNKPYWTMTPAYYSANNAYNFVVSINKLTEEVVTKEYIVRPVITVRSDLYILKGDGSLDNPFIL